MDANYAYVFRGSKEDIDYIETLVEEDTDLEIIYMTSSPGKLMIKKEMED
jgi:hypothetical protein